MWTERKNRVADEERNYNIGMDEHGKLMTVSEEFLKERIARFKKYRTTLLNLQDEFEMKLEICDADLKVKKEGSESAND